MYTGTAMSMWALNNLVSGFRKKHMELAVGFLPTTAEVSPLPIWAKVFGKGSPHACKDFIDTFGAQPPASHG
jgi:hypothetical protein